MTVAAYTLVPASGIGAAIVNLNANPSVRATAGQGGVAHAFINEGFAVAPINMPITNFLPLVRIPTNAIVKKVEIPVRHFPVHFSDAIVRPHLLEWWCGGYGCGFPGFWFFRRYAAA